MDDPTNRHGMDWRRIELPAPGLPVLLAQRLAPQLIFKGGILNTWQRKMAVALNKSFFNTLPVLDEVDKADADIAWLVYDLRP